jgi:hypothetical protein
MSGPISFFRATLRNGALDYRIESGTALLGSPGSCRPKQKNIGQGPKNTNGWLIHCLWSPPKVLCWKWREHTAPWPSRRSATDRRPPQLAASSFGSIIAKYPRAFRASCGAFSALRDRPRPECPAGCLSLKYSGFQVFHIEQTECGGKGDAMNYAPPSFRLSENQ